MWLYLLFALSLLAIFFGVLLGIYTVNKDSNLSHIKLLEAEKKLYGDLGNKIRVKNIKSRNNN